MISVCVVSFNGEKYIGEQISSILKQIGKEDEIIVSDDGSVDDTLKILKSFNDDRIKVYNHDKGNKEYTFTIDYVVHNVEYALSLCKGDIIFLSDQDDIWLPSKLSEMVSALYDYDMVMSNCFVVDANLNILHSSYFDLIHTNTSILKNFVKSSYLGCCMAFKREILTKVLPFPSSGVGHDLWIGLICSFYFKIKLLETPLLLYRKHGDNVTPTLRSSYSLLYRIRYRLKILQSLFKRILIENVFIKSAAF